MKAKRRIGLGLLVLLLLLSLATTVFASAEDPGTGEYIPEETTARPNGASGNGTRRRVLRRRPHRYP